MNGFDRLKEQVKGQEDSALNQVIEYLISRDDMEQKYLNEEKNVKEMCNFIKGKGKNVLGFTKFFFKNKSTKGNTKYYN